jgi:hypothetical protein
MALYIHHVPEISMQLMETVKSSHKVLYYIAAGLKDAGRETIKPFSAFLLAAPKQPFSAQPQRMALRCNSCQSSEFPKKNQRRENSDTTNSTQPFCPVCCQGLIERN